MNEEVIKRPTVHLRGKTFYIEMTRYTDNENTCIVLLDAEGAMQYKVTVNLEPLAPQFCYVKDYSENKGMVTAMKRYLAPTGAFRHSGAVRIHQFEIADELLEMAGIEVRQAGQNIERDEPVDVDDEPIEDISFEQAQAASAAHEEGGDAPPLPDADVPPAAA